MERYTIYCTEEQTRKALELGAPIKHRGKFEESFEQEFRDERGGYYKTPTAEQMIGWLEEQEPITSPFHIGKPMSWEYEIGIRGYKHLCCCGFDSRKEATLAAIDAALDYLSKK